MERHIVKHVKRLFWVGIGLLVLVPFAVRSAGLRRSAVAQQQQKRPNILFIMGDDIGWMQVGAYHRGIGLGETPNIDRIAHEGGTFTTYYAMQSCTSGRNAFITGMYPLRTGMIPPQLPVMSDLSETRHADD